MSIPPNWRGFLRGQKVLSTLEASRTFVTVKTALWQVRKTDTDEVNASSGE
jgi:hypothetical protein